MASIGVLAAILLSGWTFAQGFELDKAYSAARAASERGDDAGALREASRTLSRIEGAYGSTDSRTLVAVARHGDYARRAGQPQSVDADIKRLLAVEPPSREALIEAARLLRQTRRAKESLAVASRAAALWPG